MGRMNAMGMAEAVRDGTTSLKDALTWHLMANHYPAVPVSMIPACIAAIDAVNVGDDERLIDLPEGCRYRGEPQAPASAIVEQHHLDSFLNMEDEDDG